MSTWQSLQQKFAIFFVIGLALSIASFIEGLHMGQDAIRFAVSRLSELTGLQDIFRFIADSFHNLFEWWREAVRNLLSIFGISIPEWLHDPLSVVFFSVSRTLTRARAWITTKDVQDGDDRPTTLKLSRRLSIMSEIPRDTVLSLVVPMVAALAVDSLYAGNMASFAQPTTFAQFAIYAITVALFLVTAFVLARWSFDQQLRERRIEDEETRRRGGFFKRKAEDDRARREGGAS